MAPAEPATTRRIRLSARPLRPRLSRLSTRVVLPASTIGRRTIERPSLLTRRLAVVRDGRHHLLHRIVTRTLRSTGASKDGGTPRESPLLLLTNITSDSHKSAVRDLMVAAVRLMKSKDLQTQTTDQEVKGAMMTTTSMPLSRLPAATPSPRSGDDQAFELCLSPPSDRLRAYTVRFVLYE